MREDEINGSERFMNSPFSKRPDDYYARTIRLGEEEATPAQVEEPAERLDPIAAQRALGSLVTTIGTAMVFFGVAFTWGWSLGLLVTGAIVLLFRLIR